MSGDANGVRGIEHRKVGVLLDAYAAGADDAAVVAIAGHLGVHPLDLGVWRMRARASIDAARRDFEILAEARAWRARRRAEALAALGPASLCEMA